MVKIKVDGREFLVRENKNILEAVLSEKINLQYFCWHPKLGSIGACRQCAVKKFKDENDSTGRIVMACMEPVSKDTIISINDPEAAEFRAGVIEWLMINHPHDCPVCDEGGECHLQDMTVMSGHNYRRYSYSKRTYRNQYLGPLINHEMNRCIQCYRCVRFYKDYAEGKDFDVFGIHNNVYFGRAEDGILENEFSGNLIEVCPTGVFTDKTLKQHYTRKWDLTNAPSICNNCSLGCNIIASERYGTLRRILTRHNSEVNGYFLCDRGRFGYESVNSSKRIQVPFIRRGHGEFSIAAEEEVVMKAGSAIRKKKTAGIGSPRASLESNFALMKLVGKENFYSGMARPEFELSALVSGIMKNGSVKIPSLSQVEQCEAVFVLGEDVTNTAPMMALALRQASRKKAKEKASKLNIPEWHDNAVRDITRNDRGPFYIAHPFPTKLDDIAAGKYSDNPDNIARFAFALANRISVNAPEVSNMDDQTAQLINSITKNINGIKSGLVVCGTSLFNADIIRSGYNLALALKEAGIEAYISFILPECNSVGLSLLADKCLDDLSAANYEDVIVLENDLYRRKEKASVKEFLSGINNLIVIDHLRTPTAEMADILIPAGAFSESDGTLVNNEGRAQRFFKVYDPGIFNERSNIRESWRWIKLIGESANIRSFTDVKNFSDLTNALAEEAEIFKSITAVSPPPGYRTAGQKIPREPHRFSGRTAMLADKSVHDPKPPSDNDSPLGFTMEGFSVSPPSTATPFYWSPGWNSVQAINKYQVEVGGPLHGGNPGIKIFEVKQGNGKYFTEIPGKTLSRGEEVLLLPVYHIFGSEEQSSYAASLQELISEPYIMLNPADLKKLKISDNQIEVKLNGFSAALKINIHNKVKGGTAGIPFGLPGIEFIAFPRLLRVSE